MQIKLKKFLGSYRLAMNNSQDKKFVIVTEVNNVLLNRCNHILCLASGYKN